MATKIHKGLMLQCPQCSPEFVPKKTRGHKSKTTMTLDIAMRKQVAMELGEEETPKDERYVLLQKYGVVTPKIDRLVTKPTWMGDVEWKRKMNEWYKATKGLVTQTRPTGPNRPWRKNHQQGTRTFRGNSGPTRTESRPSSQRNY